MTGVVAFVGIFVLRSDARYLFDGLTSRALPIVILSAILGTASLLLLMRQVRPLVRFVAAAAVIAVLLAWGVAQWDYLLPESLTVSQAAATTGTITAVLVAVGLAVIFVLPSFVLLYILDQRGRLPGEGVEQTEGS